MANQRIQVETARLDMASFYMAILASDIFGAARTGGRNVNRPWSRYLLYCIAAELSLKSILLNNNNTSNKIKKNKKIGHNLVDLWAEAVHRLSANFLDPAEVQAIKLISPFFASKSLEYVSGKLLAQMLTGGKDLPQITDLEKVVKRIINHLQQEDYFKGSNTPA